MSKKQKKQVPIAVRATIARINRKLAHEGQRLRTTRGARSRIEMGDYFLVDAERGFLVAGHVDPEKLARELGVLRPWETVVEGGVL